MDLEIDRPQSLLTKKGCFRYKYHMRSAFKAASLIALVAGFCVYNYFYTHDGDGTIYHRRLDTNNTLEDDSNMNGIFQKRADPEWLLAPYIFGILYMFLALAIICDEYFVPALEEMSGEHQMNMSLDIAGATLMAAGGSAPELFTSFIGTFQRSEVGFGTIVGSATFNVLFVIGMCSMLSKEVLQLTWWPLFRDCTYYAISLLVLAVFVGVVGMKPSSDCEETHPQEFLEGSCPKNAFIDLWEAIVLFAMYIGYVVVMKFNKQLHRMLTGKELVNKDEENASQEGSFMSFKYHTTFRAGLLTLILDPDSWLDKARVGFVSKISGNVDEVFDFVDENRDGELSRDEIRKCFDKLEDHPISDTELFNIFQLLDTNKDGTVTKIEFKTWYLHSESHIKEQIRKIFDKYDSNQSGTIYKQEFKKLLAEVEPTVNESELDDVVDLCYQNKSELSFDDFTYWYFNSTYYEKQQKRTEHEDHDATICETILPPKGVTFYGFLKYLFLLPIVAPLALTIPDVRRSNVPGKLCYLAFILSIIWIGICSYFMVGWADTVGTTVGIPSFLMGLTFLAAGTSVPDLLSSVIVARMGEGDMAVSSSIGSNIFDILVGLPLPWMCFCLYTGESVEIKAEDIWISIMILLGMIVAIVVTIHFSGWKLTKGLGWIMFLLYFAFLIQAVLREYL